ncbi:Protein RFT1 [Amphibalanus amphitrite]|uniref:Protein RFT1 homolog n=1 Tax=Amphibalanus amphitrite TaxID=1232801 RepID=A0A6A4W0X3_AMPAM|nr:Protein RFT1 [Amphibalanus amphitrite]
MAAVEEFERNFCLLLGATADQGPRVIQRLKLFIAVKQPQLGTRVSRNVPVSAAVSAALAGLWLHALSQPAPEVTSEYRLGVWVTAAMVVLETAAQPLVILAQAMLFVKLKVVADMVTLCSRVALKAWLIALYPSHAIWAYCVGHAVSSALLVVIYYGTLLWHVRSPDNCLPVKSASELGPRLVPGQPVSAAGGRVLHDLLRAMSLLCLVAVTFGWSYSHLLLRLYGGALLTAGPAVSLLRAQCAYVLLLAVNGVLECYTFAVMRQEQINGYNRKMVLLSVIFVISTGIFTRLFGGVGLILANCVNMLTRIYVCYRFVAGLPLEPAVSVPPLLGLRPPPAVAAALVTAGLLAAGSESWLYSLS